MAGEPQSHPPAATWAGDAESHDQFSHTPAIQAGLLAMIVVAFTTLWLMWQIPFPSVRLAGSCVPAVLALYLVYRLYLTMISLEFFSDRVEIRSLTGVMAVPYQKIRGVRFDTFSHDMMIADDTREYRVPRTIQGHRAILHRLHQSIEVERDHSPEMEVEVRRLPKMACAVSLASMISLAWVAAVQLPQVSILLLVLCVPTAYVLLDQCMLRSYHFRPEALFVKGIRGWKVYPRAELKDSWITKSGLSGRFQMTFARGTVQFDEYLLSKALIQVTGYVENRWMHRVTPLSRRN